MDYLETYKEWLERRDYTSRTVETYLSAVKDLIDFYPKTSPDKLTFKQLSEFVDYLIDRKNAKPSTVRIYASSFEHFFNSLLEQEYDIRSLKIPPIKREIPEILTPNEVVRVLNSVLPNIKHYSALALIYSAGLRTSELLRLRIDDVDFQNRQIKVRNSGGEVIRVAILAESLISDLKYYLSNYQPLRWFFEGREEGKSYSPTSIQRAFKKALKACSIDKDVSITNLKYSYVKHVEMYGVPLSTILQEMGISNSVTVSEYSQMGNNEVNLTFSPLDRIIHEDTSDRVDASALEKSYARLRDENEKSYMLEALKCLSARAPRAAVVFAWNAAIRNIQRRFLQHDVKSINKAIRKHAPGASWVKQINDFDKINDRPVVEASEKLGIFSKSEKMVIVNCLDLRNQCGHPSTYIPGNHRVAAFFEDLYTIVFDKPFYTKSQQAIKSDGNDLPF